MLALTCKSGDTIEVKHNGETLLIHIQKVGGSGVGHGAKIAFDAPRSFDITLHKHHLNPEGITT